VIRLSPGDRARSCCEPRQAAAAVAASSPAATWATDPAVAALLAGLGHGAGRAVGALPGAIDQAVDSVDILERPDRCRAAAPILGLPGRMSL
jgi:hypothetical protein